MRIVVVGGGVIGLLSAVYGVQAGHQVLVVDQAAIPFSGSTSFDRHRVLKALYLDDPVATGAAVRAHHQWLRLQRLLATRIYEPVGALSVLPADELSRAQRMLTDAGSGAHLFGPLSLAATYPQVRFPAGSSAVLEDLAGVLLADRVLTAGADWLRQSPLAELLPYRTVVRVDTEHPAAGPVAVELAGGEVLAADAVLLATGPWSRPLLPADLAAGLVLCRQSMVYCRVPAADAAVWSATPPLSALGMATGGWLVPPIAGTPLKLSAASAGRVVPDVGDTTTPRYWRDHLIEQFTPVVRGLRADWLVDARDAYYLMRRSTGGPLLAVLGERVVSYAACGGFSFKFAPLIARSLVQYLVGAGPPPTGFDPAVAGVVRVPSHRPVM
ncbi:FAD-dependent oxidoreductase [Dactylosporangium sp. NPDC005572]|uniref:FAD-dependent oxidoreductase n=1 Tax=Dactylosporangium sp. NPDC005572 TaxID=3156889 RepID=UPI0033B8E163